MIVVCPTCRTRYRHELDRESARSIAHCASCDERFPLCEPKAPYRIVTPALATEEAPAVAPTAGVLADATAAATSNLDAPAVLPAVDGLGTGEACASEIEIEIEVPADTLIDPASVEPEVTAEPQAPVHEDEYQAPAAEPMVDPGPGDLQPSEPPAEAEAPVETVPEEAAPVAPTRGRALGEAGVALIPSGLGAFVAYHAAGRLEQDPVTWASLGGAIGLLLGWACLLWITRGD